MKNAILVLAVFLSAPTLWAQDTFRLDVLSYQWTTTNRTMTFSWPGHSNTSCNGNAYTNGYVSGEGNFSANTTGYSTCSTTYQPPTNQTIDVRKPVVFILADTENTRLVLTCTRNVRWSQCHALNPGTFLARNNKGHFEVQASAGNKEEWVRFDIIQQTVLSRQQPQTTNHGLGEQRAHLAKLDGKSDELSGPVSSDDVTRAASYSQKCSNGDMQGCANLGTMYRMGWGVSKDSSQAGALFKKACDGGNMDGCKGLGSFSPTASSPKTDATTPVATQASVSIASIPSGADIEIDGAFVGNTPSTVSIALGSHQIAVKKKGFINWSKTLNVTGGTIRLDAELEQESTKP